MSIVYADATWMTLKILSPFLALDCCMLLVALSCPQPCCTSGSSLCVGSFTLLPIWSLFPSPAEVCLGQLGMWWPSRCYTTLWSQCYTCSRVIASVYHLTFHTKFPAVYVDVLNEPAFCSDWNSFFNRGLSLLFRNTSFWKKKKSLSVFPIHGLHCQNIRLSVPFAICKVLTIINMQWCCIDSMCGNFLQMHYFWL